MSTCSGREGDSVISDCWFILPLSDAHSANCADRSETLRSGGPVRARWRKQSHLLRKRTRAERCQMNTHDAESMKPIPHEEAAQLVPAAEGLSFLNEIKRRRAELIANSLDRKSVV